MNTSLLMIWISYLLVTIPTVTAISCYCCESVFEKDCGADFDFNEYFKLDCSRVAPPRYLVHELDITTGNRNSTACMKRSYTENGHRKIVRSCFFGDVNETSVGCTMDPSMADLEDVTCHVCDNENYCNLATKPFWTLETAIATFGFFLVSQSLTARHH